MDSIHRLWIDLQRDGGPMLIVSMLLVKLLPLSWIRLRGLSHRYHYNPLVQQYGYVMLMVEVHVWLLGWRRLAIRQDAQWQHLSLFSVSNTSDEQLQRITRALDGALRRGRSALDFLHWQAWPCYSTNALVWPPHHHAITALLGEGVRWYSSYTYHVVV